MRNFTFFAMLMVLALVGCSEFNRSHFMATAFGSRLNELTVGKPIAYTDGCLEVRNVATNDAVYQTYYALRNTIHTSDCVVIESLKKEYRASPSNDVRYILWGKGFDGYQPMVLYFPKRQTMVFMFSTGLM